MVSKVSLACEPLRAHVGTLVRTIVKVPTPDMLLHMLPLVASYAVISRHNTDQFYLALHLAVSPLTLVVARVQQAPIHPLHVALEREVERVERWVVNELVFLAFVDRGALPVYGLGEV